MGQKNGRKKYVYETVPVAVSKRINHEELEQWSRHTNKKMKCIEKIARPSESSLKDPVLIKFQRLWIGTYGYYNTDYNGDHQLVHPVGRFRSWCNNLRYIHKAKRLDGAWFSGCEVQTSFGCTERHMRRSQCKWLGSDSEVKNGSEEYEKRERKRKRKISFSGW